MEFYREVYIPGLDADRLKRLLSINNLTTLCESIDTVNPNGENAADIYCIWGSFDVRREEIRYGVRFTLLNCPHALAWTVTFDEASRNIIIHCTIDKRETDPDFIDSIHVFVSDWSSGIAAALR